MSSILSSHGMAFATAMAVSAGTFIILALHLSDGKTKKMRAKKKKRVRFAADVVDPRSDGEEFRRKSKIGDRTCSCSSEDSGFVGKNGGNGVMPENRTVLYNGILRDRPVYHRFANYDYYH